MSLSDRISKKATFLGQVAIYKCFKDILYLWVYIWTQKHTHHPVVCTQILLESSVSLVYSFFSWALFMVSLLLGQFMNNSVLWLINVLKQHKLWSIAVKCLIFLSDLVVSTGLKKNSEMICFKSRSLKLIIFIANAT